MKIKPAKDMTKAEDGEAIVIEVTKSKKPIEIDLPEEVAEAVVAEEKIIDDESALAEDAEDAAAEEVTLDDDELNPFGDKWEQ